MNGADKIDLNDTEDGVCWTDEVAAPGKINIHIIPMNDGNMYIK